jgi:hypothetical protein
MNSPYTKNEEHLASKQQNQNRSRSEAAIGLDMDEQAMNGSYGMPETEAEDRSIRK